MCPLLIFRLVLFFSLRISYHKFFFVCVCVLPSRINVGSEGGRQSDGRKKLALRCWVRVPYWRHHPALNYSSPCDVENKVLSLRLFGLDSLHTHTHRDPARLSFVLLPPPFSFLVCHCLFVVIIIFFLFLGKSGAFFLFCFLNHSNRGSICYRLPFCIVSCCVKFNALACPSFLFYYLFFSSRDNYYFVSSFSFLFSCLCVYRIVAYTAKTLQPPAV